MTSTSTIPHFNFDTLPTDLAKTLRLEIKRLRQLLSKSSGNMIQIGRDLLAIKADLKHGQFVLLVETEIGIKIRTAQFYMQMASLANDKGEIVSLFPPPIIRMLAKKTTPAHIVDHVISKAVTGQILAESTVNAMITDAKEAERAPQREAEAEACRAKAEKAAAKRAIRQVKREQKLREDQAKAQSIIDRLSIDEVRFLANTFDHGVLDEFLKLIREDAVA